ncbi:MAG: hypothetical protein BGO25_14780 [Acidobacteriales bacterium 59-55]|nr:hypothetical protein [Terriglobales bacterium]OJV41032.1 MAG: hypothetical protein BGO25_14780 [Acidobacteriales bacterium 59-55]
MQNKKISKIIVTTIGLAVAFCFARPATFASSFTVVGPGGGGAMFHATISPHDAKEALVACDMTGSYITHDGGHSWRMFNLRGPVRFFVFDPVESRTIYAATEGLWRSTDDGVSWKLLWPQPSTIRGIRMSSDHADETIVAEPNPMGQVVALAIDPDDSKTLVAGAVKDGKAAVFLSSDNGKTWTKAQDLEEAPQQIWIDPQSNKSDRDLYIAGKMEITVRYRGKWQNRPGPKGVVFNDVSAGFSAQRGMTLYASSDAGIFLSKDGGVSWTSAALPGSGAKARAIATSLNHPESAYASYSHLQIDGKIWMGVARTRDSGRTWKLVWKEDKTSSPNIHDAWLSQEYGPEWGENPLGLGVADQDAELAYGTDFGRTMITADGGANWNAAYSRRVEGGGWTSTGLDVTTNYGYLFDPFNPGRRFIPTTDIGLFRSEDGGRSWIHSVRGVPEKWINTTYWVTFDPKVQGKMWGAMSATHDLPRPKMWRTTPVTKYRGGICVSVDGGRTWKPSNAGMPETAPTHILLDPSSPVGKRTLWAAAMGRGVYKSTDDGVTWALKNHGIVQNEPLAWRLARAEDGTLYVVIARRSENGSIGTGGDGALYKSTDGAESWTPVKLPAEVNGPNGLAIDPHDPNRLYLAAWTRATGMHGVGGGIFLSTDGGKNWKNVLHRDQHVYDVTIDPRNPDNLYASGFESSAWHSIDRGEHWNRISGYNFKWGHRVMPDPENPGMVYIATFGGGVWHGAASGDQRRPDIATPELEPGH